MCADISMFGWVFCAAYVGIDVEADYPNLGKWMNKIAAREAVKEGMAVPEPSSFVEKFSDAEKKKETIQEALDIIKAASK